MLKSQALAWGEGSVVLDGGGSCGGPFNLGNNNVSISKKDLNHHCRLWILTLTPLKEGTAPSTLETSKVRVFHLGVRTELGSFKSLRVSVPVFTNVVVILRASTSSTADGAVNYGHVNNRAWWRASAPSKIERLLTGNLEGKATVSDDGAGKGGEEEGGGCD